MIIKLKDVIVVFLLCPFTFTGCNINVPYAEDRNYEAEYKSTKEAIKKRSKRFQKKDTLTKNFPDPPDKRPFEIAVQDRGLHYPSVLNKKPDRKGGAKASYDLAKTQISKKELLKKDNIGNYYLLSGKLLNKKRTKKYNHFLFIIRERQSRQKIVLFIWKNSNRKSSRKLNQINTGRNLHAFGYHSGFFDYQIKGEKENKKELMPTFFVTSVILLD